MNVVQFPIVRYDAEAADEAFAAYAALVKAEAVDPSILRNPSWWRIRRYAYDQFARAFEAPE